MVSSVAQNGAVEPVIVLERRNRDVICREELIGYA